MSSAAFKKVAAADPFIMDSQGGLIPVREIVYVDISKLESKHIIHVETQNSERYEINGIQAIEALLTLKPSALEGKRMGWARQAWFIHNTVGHGYLAIVALIADGLRPHAPQTAKRMIKHGLYVHDTTCPRPKV